jgi:hypothetical protein
MNSETKNMTVCDEIEDVVFQTQEENDNTNTNDQYMDKDDLKLKCTMIDGLENDKDVQGYKYVLVSTISPENILNCDTWGIKIRGFEEKEEKAEKKAELMRKRDKYFDVFVGVNGAWHPLNPSNAQIENEKYGNEKLNKIMKKVHESEKKQSLEEMKMNLEKEKEEDDEYDIIKNLEKKKREQEQEQEQEFTNNTNYIYDNEDCLDEDPVIPEQRFAIISFISPEIAFNYKERAFKVRGYSHNLGKAQQIAKKLEETDKNFNIIIVEIGKWTAINFKLMTKMRNYDANKQIEKQKNELRNLNEIIGRYKKNLDSRKEILEKRKLEKIKQGAQELNGEFDKEQELNVENNNEIKEIRQLGKNKEEIKERLKNLISNNKMGTLHTTQEPKQSVSQELNSQEKKPQKLILGDDRQSRIERMRQKLANKRAAQAEAENKKENLQEKQIKIRQEALRINEKKQNIEDLKSDKEKLEANLKKMKEILANRVANK